MGDFLRYNHFDRLSAPVAAVDPSGRVIYRNKAALKLTRAFRSGRNVLPFFPDEGALFGCMKNRNTALCSMRFPEGDEHAVLLIPDHSPEGARALLVLAPLLEGALDCRPEVPAFSASAFVKGTAELPGKRALSALDRALLNAYARLPASICDPDTASASFTVASLCLLLNRLFDQTAPSRSRRDNVQIKCTRDCCDFPVVRFKELSACLVYLSLIFSAVSEDGGLSLVFSCEKERLHILFDFRADVFRPTLSEIFPQRRIELSILDALLDSLRFDIRIGAFRDHTQVELSSRDRFPAHLFKTPDEEQRRYQILWVCSYIESLLSFPDGV